MPKSLVEFILLFTQITIFERRLLNSIIFGGLTSPLDQLLFQGDAEGVLRKVDYEYQRRCS